MLTCRACGHENPETSRFCGACAAPLGEDTHGPDVRKAVTVLFCDLVGSTAMAEGLDPEALRLVTRRYFDAMRVPIDRHGGTVEKFIGDAMMAAFGVPQVHEDDALRAVRAAAEMRTVLDGLNPELGRYDEAERLARTAVDAHDDALGRHAGMGVLARILARRGEPDEAERLAREAVAFFEATEFGAERTSVLLDLAEVLGLAGRPDEAAIALRQALELFERREDVVSSARTRAAIADLG